MMQDVNNTQNVNDRQILDDVRSVLAELLDMGRFDIAYDGNPDYVVYKKKLLKLMTGDVETATRIIGMLDFYNPIDAHILRFMPEIVGNMKDKNEGKRLIKAFYSVQEQFPEVNFLKNNFYIWLALAE